MNRQKIHIESDQTKIDRKQNWTKPVLARLGDKNTIEATDGTGADGGTAPTS